MSKITRLRRPAAVATAAIAAAAMLSGCMTQSAQYITNSSAGAYLKVPSGWTIYSEQQMLNAQTPGSTATPPPGLWLVGFDASSQPSAKDVFTGDTNSPIGLALVRPVTQTTTSTGAVSLSTLRNFPFAIDQGVKNGSIRVVHSQTLKLAGGAQGLRMLFVLNEPNGQIAFSQTSLVAAGGGNLYLLLVGCRVACFQGNSKAIDGIVSSWTVKPMNLGGLGGQQGLGGL